MVGILVFFMILVNLPLKSIVFMLFPGENLIKRKGKEQGCIVLIYARVELGIFRTFISIGRKLIENNKVFP